MRICSSKLEIESKRFLQSVWFWRIDCLKIRNPCVLMRFRITSIRSNPVRLDFLPRFLHSGQQVFFTGDGFIINKGRSTLGEFTMARIFENSDHYSKQFENFEISEKIFLHKMLRIKPRSKVITTQMISLKMRPRRNIIKWRVTVVLFVCILMLIRPWTRRSSCRRTKTAPGRPSCRQSYSWWRKASSLGARWNAECLECGPECANSPPESDCSEKALSPAPRREASRPLWSPEPQGQNSSEYALRNYNDYFTKNSAIF